MKQSFKCFSFPLVQKELMRELVGQYLFLRLLYLIKFYTGECEDICSNKEQATGWETIIRAGISMTDFASWKLMFYLLFSKASNTA